MRDAVCMWRYTKMVVLAALTAALYAALLIPFKPIPIIPGITEVRPANVVPIVCSLLFGPAAAWGSAFGNLLGDFFGTLGPGSFFGFIGNFILGYLPYRLWLLIAPSRRPTGKPSDWPAFFAVTVVSSAACAVVIAWGVHLLGLVPFPILATTITLNNALVAIVLGVILLPLIYPRADRWDLVYWRIMPQHELASSPAAWPAALLVAAASLGGAAWAASLFGSQAGDVTGTATVLSLVILGATALLAPLPPRVQPAARGVELERAEGPLLEIQGLTFQYPRADRPALEEVSLTQRPGQMRLLMGPTGAGKTTLCHCAAGIIPNLQPGQYSGVVRVAGQQLAGLPPRALAGIVGLLMQDFEAQLVGSRVRQAVAFPLECLGVPSDEIRARVASALQRLGIAHLADRDPLTLSGGERQRTALAAVSTLDPALLILDEPTTDLDPEAAWQLVEAWPEMRADGTSLLICEHQAEIAHQAGADILTVLHEGRIAYDGPPEALLRDPVACRRMGLIPLAEAEVAAALGLDGAPLQADQLAAHIQSAGYQPAPELVRNLPPASQQWPEPGEVVVRLDAVSASYPAAGDVLRGVNFQAREGELVAILGPNGAGKSTLLKVIDGLLAPSSGQVELCGWSPVELTRPEVARLAGLLFQNPDHQIVQGRVWDEVAMAPRLAGAGEAEVQRLVADALALTRLEEYAEADPFALPKGLRQRVALASVLAFRPRVILFDEPTTGLDGLEQERMMALLADLARQGCCVIVVTHAVWAAARYASRIVLMAEGSIIADGPPREVFGDWSALERARVRPPACARLSKLLGISVPLLTPEEFPACLRREEVGS